MNSKCLEINNLKQQLKSLNQKESRLNTEEDYSKTNRKSKDQLADKVNDLINRVSYLEKLMNFYFQIPFLNYTSNHHTIHRPHQNFQFQPSYYNALTGVNPSR